MWPNAGQVFLPFGFLLGLSKGSLSSLTWTLTTLGCGGSTRITVRRWNPKNMLTQFGSGLAARAARNLWPVPPVNLASDSGAAHATCFALGEATRGDNAITALINAVAQSCDHTAEMEVPGFVPGTDLRPADVLTSALGNAYTALDV